MPLTAYVRSPFISACLLALCASSFAACSGTDGEASGVGGSTAAGAASIAGGGGGTPSIAGSSPVAGAANLAGAGSAQGGALNTGGVGNTAGTAPIAGAASVAGGGSGGTPGAAGSSNSGGVCRPAFASGVNVAWVKFAADIPGPTMSKFTEIFKNVKASGGSAVRWWFHTTGMTTPGYDSGGKAKAISSDNIADLKKILDAAHAEGVGVVISLWSFGMLDSDQTTDAGVRANNKLLLENDTNRQAYIDNVLTPMVTALKGYPGLYAWEIFNEPEGMSSDNGGWTKPDTGRTAAMNLQKTVNWFTSAIHTADPAALVTNGANNFSTLSPSHGKNLWSDSALTAAGSKANGTLDFYEVHYYNTYSGASSNSPFLHPQSYWGLDKKVVIGEFWTDTTDSVQAADLYTTLHTNQYAGGWAWQYVSVDNPGPSSGASTIWPAMKAPMDKLLAAAPQDLTCP